jgi:hypothetical protein
MMGNPLIIETVLGENEHPIRLEIGLMNSSSSNRHMIWLSGEYPTVGSEQTLENDRPGQAGSPHPVLIRHLLISSPPHGGPLINQNCVMPALVRSAPTLLPMALVPRTAIFLSIVVRCVLYSDFSILNSDSWQQEIGGFSIDSV